MIKITNLSKAFSGNQVLDHLDLEINEGDVVALIGASGAGKSTFLRSLNNLENPDSGQIEIDDLKIDFAHLTKKEVLALRRKTGMVFQQFNLFERRTALENVMEGLIQVKKLPKEKARLIAEQELEKVGLTDRKDYYPKFLSGGQKQRVGIARALAMEPKLLLLDEPTSALDPEMINEVLDVMVELAHEGMTMMCVTHEMGFARQVANRVLFMDQGKIVEDCSKDDFFNTKRGDRAQQFLDKILH